MFLFRASFLLASFVGGIVVVGACAPTGSRSRPMPGTFGAPCNSLGQCDRGLVCRANVCMDPFGALASYDAALESGVTDSGLTDRGSVVIIVDGGIGDAANDVYGDTDAAVELDSGEELDVGVIDTGSGLLDSGLIDVGVFDAGVIDTGVVDAGVRLDARDTGVDARATDTGADVRVDAPRDAPTDRGVDAPMCLSGPTTTVCGRCLNGACCAEMRACDSSIDCLDYLDCLDTCATCGARGTCNEGLCYGLCDATYPDAVPVFNAFIDCADVSCTIECSAP